MNEIIGDVVYSGKCITFEGGEGVGKGTQISLLRNHLVSEGYRVSSLDLYEPGSTPVGDLCRIVVKNKVDKPHLHPYHNVQQYIQDQDITPFTQVCLFMASRAEIYDKRIRPELEKGEIVLLDRSIDSTTAYQGHAQNKDLVPLIRSMNERAVEGANIDLTLLLDMDIKPALGRVTARGGGGDRFEDKNLAYHRLVREGFREEAKKFPRRIKIVDGSPKQEQVHKHIYHLVKKILDS